MDELLVKYLAGEADANERAQADIWVQASAENKKYFEHFKLLWDESEKLAHDSAIDEDKAWHRFRERIHQDYVTATNSTRNFQWLKVAAVILLVSATALFGPYFFTQHDGTRSATTQVNNHPATLLKSVTTDKTKVDTLPDGSVITLNKYSSIKYPAAFKGRTRDVELSGEAFFRVKHDPGKPFEINVNDVLITVLGTSFNVKSIGDKTEVIVETGIVSVKKQTKSIMLYPGEKVTTFKTDTTLKKELNKDTLYRKYIYKQPAHAFKKAVKGKTDTPFDINRHPDLLKQILKDPAKLAKLLKTYGAQSESLPVRRAVINSVLDELAKENIAAKGTVISFRLNEGEFFVNDLRQPEAVHQKFKNMFIKEPGYNIYFGNAPRNGKGIFLSPDSL
jgi:transmembrane sensor